MANAERPNPYDDDDRGPIWAAIDLAGWPTEFTVDSVRQLMADAIYMDRLERDAGQLEANPTMEDQKISFDDAMQIVLEAVDPAHHKFAKVMMRAGARLVLSAIDKADDLEGLKLELSSDPTTPSFSVYPNI